MYKRRRACAQAHTLSLSFRSRIVEHLLALADGATAHAGTHKEAAHKRGELREGALEWLCACAYARQAVRTSVMRSLVDDGEAVVVLHSQSA
jgi:hypothetical protein